MKKYSEEIPKMDEFAINDACIKRTQLLVYLRNNDISATVIVIVNIEEKNKDIIGDEKWVSNRCGWTDESEVVLDGGVNKVVREATSQI